MTPEGEGKVVRQNVMEQRVVVALIDGREIEFHLAELSPGQASAGGSQQGADKPETDAATQEEVDTSKND